VEVGVTTTCSDFSVDAATVARMVEDAGIPFLGFGEHTHIPASRETPYPGGGSADKGALPPGYERSIDLFVTLTVAALATSTLKLGTGILQMVQRDPIVTAKAIASVDLVSGGRFVPITGSSWNLEEMRNHGTDPATRYELLEERVLAMREIWANDEATFHGDFVNFDRIWCWPKPIQNPMPIYIGGNSPGTEERAMRAGTGWSSLHTPDMPERVAAYLERADAEGVETSVAAVGGPLSAELIESYAKAGAKYWLFGIQMSDDPGVYERAIEALVAANAEFAASP
jgi:probable F420-dependent oxidoreductase